MIESIFIGILFIGAVFYLFRLLKNHFLTKESGCAKGCGSCNGPSAKVNHHADHKVTPEMASRVNQ
jgi:hypothetical protein